MAPLPRVWVSGALRGLNCNIGAGSGASGANAPARPEAANENGAVRDNFESTIPRRALVVEDQAIIAMEVEDVLTEIGCEVLGLAVDAEEAIAMAESLRPDFITMDINLGRGRDGISAAIEIYERLGIRSIFVSAYGNEATIARAHPARPFGWVPKPISENALRAVLDTLPPRRS